jgi:two-component SAPR family response regulator
MLIHDLDEISLDVEEQGVLLKKQIAKSIIAKGSWPVAVFLYRELDEKKKDYGTLKTGIYKFRKIQDSYRIQGKINLPSFDDAVELAKVILKWKEDFAD